ncbi:MAG: hypothetical protein SF123_13775 [Chloroflexota bacterium]|nr:hypothetical protein [Chloroflexota bacterium]
MAKRKSTQVIHSQPTTYRFGFRGDDIDAAAKLIRPLLKIRWKRLDDPFWGGVHYLQMRKNGIIIKLHHNYEAHFDHWLQPGYRDYPLLLMMQYPPGIAAPDEAALFAQFSDVIETVIIPPNTDIWDNTVVV